MPLSLPTLAEIQSKDPRTYQALRAIQDAFNALVTQLGVDPTVPVTATPAPGQLLVSAANGVVEWAIQDGSATQLATRRTLNYFVEYDTQASFATAKVISAGPSRNGREYIGSQTIYMRCYSQYQGAPASPWVMYGSPTAITPGGAAPPTPLAAQGSGTSGSPGAGYGIPPKV